MAPLIRSVLIFLAVSAGALAAGFLAAPDGGPNEPFEISEDAPVHSAPPLVAAVSGSAAIELETGWWWNPDEPGRGFVIERSGDRISVGALAYENDGRAAWYLASGALQCGNEFRGSLLAYGGGQTLSGRYRKPSMQREAGRIGIRFVGPTQATLTLPNGRAVPLERYRLIGPDLDGFEPEAGWWWNPAEPGRGFAIEARGGAILLTGIMYDDRGQPVWYVSHGTLDANRVYRGRWLRLAGGMTMDSGYRVAADSTDMGAVTVDFVDQRRATLSLPDGKSLPISRHDLGAAPGPLALTPASAEPSRACDDPIKLASITG